MNTNYKKLTNLVRGKVWTLPNARNINLSVLINLGMSSQWTQHRYRFQYNIPFYAWDV